MRNKLLILAACVAVMAGALAVLPASSGAAWVCYTASGRSLCSTSGPECYWTTGDNGVHYSPYYGIYYRFIAYDGAGFFKYSTGWGPWYVWTGC